ncbi:MAG: hypothetical protein Q8N47_21125 [Bryobacterales bacterium]|nr:hypothetical protein [Bryobacterales bacterium]
MTRLVLTLVFAASAVAQTAQFAAELGRTVLLGHADRDAIDPGRGATAGLGSRLLCAGQAGVEAIDRRVPLGHVDFDDEFELVIGGHVGSALQLSHGADKRQFFGETKQAAIQAGRLKAGSGLAKD